MNTFKHSGDFGDIIFALPIIKALYGGTLFIAPGQGTREAMTPAKMEAIRPLLMEQEDILDVKWHRGEKIKHDFTNFRERSYIPTLTLSESQRIEVLPLQTVDFSKPWLTVPNIEKHGRTVIARSARYHNPEWNAIWPEVLQRYPDALFVGLKEEHEAFERDFGKVEFRPTPDLLELAKVIAGGVLFIGNQSAPNAIAEGLKMNSILEVAPRSPDCIFPRPNAKHVRRLAEWKAIHPKPKLLLALQFWQGDAQAALELTKIITSIEPRFRTDAEFALVARFDVDERAIERIESVASERFNTRVIRSLPGPFQATGWPHGCNALWRSLMLQLAGLQGTPVKTDCNAVLTFEADCIPLRPGWIEALAMQWERSTAGGKRAFGTIVEAGEKMPRHLNGNAVFDRNFVRSFPDTQKEVFGPWDCELAKIIVPNAEHSPLILQRYGDKSLVTGETIESIRAENPAAVLLHGLKTDSGRRAVEELVKAGKF